MNSRFSLGQVAPCDIAAIVSRLRPLLASHNAGLRLFGSRARGDAGDRSDIDLAAIAPERLPGDLLARIREMLEESPIPFRADVVDYQAAPAELKQAIDREGIEWIA
jgi:predicted nucleotidyltransferase